MANILGVLVYCCSRVPPVTHSTSLPLTYEKSLGSRNLLLLNLISHYLPPTITHQHQTATDHPGIHRQIWVNQRWLPNSDAPMPPGLTLSVFIFPIRKLESTLSCPNRTQASMRSGLSDFTLKHAPVLIPHPTEPSWFTGRKSS